MALSRDSTFRLRNRCPACTYKLKGEPDLVFDMLFTMDGGDSLKRVLSRGPGTIDNSGQAAVGSINEKFDFRSVDNDYYLARGKVDAWAHEALEKLTQDELVGIFLLNKHCIDYLQPVEVNPCVSRWHNMLHEVVQKVWGIFDETGVFLALCRHGFVLVIADMVRSGEL